LSKNSPLVFIMYFSVDRKSLWNGHNM